MFFPYYVIKFLQIGGISLIKTEMQMRETEVISSVYCNVCGKEIRADDRGYYPDFVHIDKTWNYFSNKDGEVQKIDICEECWDRFTASFKLK